jgi:glycerol-3-phosphate dehydrogenase
MGQGATLKQVLTDLESTGETAEGLVAIKAAQFFAEKYKLKAPLLSEAFQFVYRKPSYRYDQRRFLSAVGI